MVGRGLHCRFALGALGALSDLVHVAFGCGLGLWRMSAQNIGGEARETGDIVVVKGCL
jgi:hypothetical protein